MEPIKTIKDRRLSYLTAIEKSYGELGYATKLDVRCNLLEIFPKGCVVPQTHEEMITEKWID